MGQQKNTQLKAYVRFDGTGRIVPSSLILQRSKPKVGNWQEIDATECCGYVPSTTTTTSSSTSTSTTTSTSTSTTTSTSTSTTTTTTTAIPLIYSLFDLAFDVPSACANTGGNLSVGIPVGETIADATTIYGNFASFAQPGGTIFYFRWVDGPVTYTRGFMTNMANTSASAVESPVACP